MGFTISEEERSELMVAYASLILHDDKAPITEENINKLIKASGGSVEAYWPGLFANLLEGADVATLLMSVGSGGGGGGGGGGDAAATEEAAPEPEPEPEEEEDEDMGFSLFD